MSYLITGATGNIGSLVTERLLARGERPCVFVRDAKKARALFGRCVDIRVGDLADAAAMASAFAGIDSLFLLNSGPGLGARDRTAAFAAKAAGVRHLVKLSTLDVQTKVGTGPWHAQGEDAVRESGVPYTFIQSAAFMSNALGWASSICSKGVLRSSTGDGKIAFIHPADIADVVTRALTTREHEGKSLVITGPTALSYGEMAAVIGAAIGKPVRFESIPDAQARKMALAWSDSKEYAEALVDIWRAIREGRLTTVSDGVERIVGRKPISFETWADENADAFA
ncbi:NAD(P)H-binding protein [Undibacterium sp. Di26W]|uniref:NAD(P)H-binding protein n=1 Tax=Undibacterium sp. Di26W TaxID=3413035 RepID=UPI003BF02AF7